MFQLSTVEGYLAQTIFIPDAEHAHLFNVNFSPRLLLMFQEVHCAFQCGIRVPTIAAFVYSRKSALLQMRDEAQVATSLTKVFQNFKKFVATTVFGRALQSVAGSC